MHRCLVLQQHVTRGNWQELYADLLSQERISGGFYVRGYCSYHNWEDYVGVEGLLHSHLKLDRSTNQKVLTYLSRIVTFKGEGSSAFQARSQLQSSLEHEVFYFFSISFY